jgi:pilus assembly protein Flp/PilA
MKRTWFYISRFLREEDGPTAVEYSVMLALIIVAAIGAIQLIGTKVTGMFEGVEAGLPTVGGGGS